jgi:hypothetical protein
MIEPGTSGAGSPVKLENAGGTIINPATDGSTTLGNGNITVTTAGTRVQLPSVLCKKVFIQSIGANGSLTNGGIIIVGGSTVLYASNNGIFLYPTNIQVYDVSNLNQVYLDASDNGAIVSYIYEA